MKYVFFFLIMAISSETFGSKPDGEEKWKISNTMGQEFYLDGENLPKIWNDGAVLYYGDTIQVPPGEGLLITNGVSQGIVNFPHVLGSRDLAVAARWDALEYLREFFPAGTQVKLETVRDFPEFSITFPVDFINDARSENNALWVYTPEYQNNTNHLYRFQAAVKAGRVVTRDGGFLTIPPDGYLLSGHGTGVAHGGATRLLNWVGEGCRIDLDIEGKQIRVSTDRETWRLRGRHLLQAASHFMANRTTADPMSQKMLHWAELLMESEVWAQYRLGVKLCRRVMLENVPSAMSLKYRAIAVDGDVSEYQLALIKEAGFKQVYFHYNYHDEDQLKRLEESAKRVEETGLEPALWCWLPSHFPLPNDVAANLSADLNDMGEPYNYDLGDIKTRNAYSVEMLKIAKRLRVKSAMLDYEGYAGGYGHGNAERLGFDPLNMSPDQKIIWEGHQRENITAMVDEAVFLLREAGIKTALCVYPGSNIDDLNGGDAAHPGPGVWLPWVKKFDAVILMMYSQSPLWLKARAEVLFPAIRTAAPGVAIDAWLIYWPEICGYTSPVPMENLLLQSEAMIKAGSDGISFFHIPNLDVSVSAKFNWILETMHQGIYRQGHGTAADNIGSN